MLQTGTLILGGSYAAIGCACAAGDSILLIEHESLGEDYSGVLRPSARCEATDAAGKELYAFFEENGVLDAEGFPTGKLRRFGYVTLTASKDCLLLRRGESIPAHEFHYWDSTAPGTDFTAEKPQSDRRWLAGIAAEHLYAGFPHFHFAARPEAAVRFLEQALAYGRGAGKS